MDDKYKIAFLRSLVLSRLTFNLHVCTMPIKAIRRLSGVYMRVLRRIAGDPRFSKVVALSDREVREKLGQPSLDCILMVARLRYLGRPVRNQPAPLLALLQAGAGEPELPWLATIRADVERVRSLGLVPGAPSLRQGPQAWLGLLRDAAKWAQILDKVCFHESCLDRAALPEHSEPCAGRGLGHQCPVCPARFPSERALASHCRAKHGHRLAVKQHIDGSGVCPACGTNFHTRLRCIARLSDKRPPPCTAWVLANVPPLPPTVVAQLNEQDRAAKREAWAQGRTRPLARGAATTRDGKRIGHCR